MDGRWTINQGGAAGPWTNEPMPVVPCDDAAIERAAQMLCREGMDYADGWVQGDTDRDYPRLIAEAVLRAAGETS
jgi:hypothetical protein